MNSNEQKEIVGSPHETHKEILTRILNQEGLTLVRDSFCFGREGNYYDYEYHIKQGDRVIYAIGANEPYKKEDGTVVTPDDIDTLKQLVDRDYYSVLNYVLERFLLSKMK